MAEVAWPDKMITQAEAFAKASNWPVWVHADTDEYTLRCGKMIERGMCKQSMGQLCRRDTVINGSLDEMLSMVLRHMVMAHDEPLNTRGKAAPDDGT
jgi:hypothetical protein